MGSLELDTTERLHFHFSLSCVGEGNGNPLQCSCLENPRDRETWWAAISGVARSWTRLKRLSSSRSIDRCPGLSQVALAVKNPPANAGDIRDLGLTPGSGGSPGEGNKDPLWRRQWHPTPVLVPRKSRGRRSLVGCSPWGH